MRKTLKGDGSVSAVKHVNEHTHNEQFLLIQKIKMLDVVVINEYQIFVDTKIKMLDRVVIHEYLFCV